MMISCKKASILMSDAMDRPLSTGEVVKLRLHLAMCKTCRGFNQQLKVIRLGASATAKSIEK